MSTSSSEAESNFVIVFHRGQPHCVGFMAVTVSHFLYQDHSGKKKMHCGSSYLSSYCIMSVSVEGCCERETK